MVSRFRVWLIEPTDRVSRNRMSEAYVSTKATSIDIDEVKRHLKNIRVSALQESESLVEEFKRVIENRNDIRLIWANNAAEAADQIACAAGSAPLIVNRSSVVLNELKGELKAKELRIIQPYYTEFPQFENRILDYWDLPRLDKAGIFPTFAESHHPLPYSALASQAVLKDCAAVLGVSAASANDGSIFFLQHSSNIRKSLEIAGTIIFIVSIDKIVPDRDDALFLAKWAGTFGLESMLLNLQPPEPDAMCMDDLVDLVKSNNRAIYLILLDNGRGKILRSEFSDILSCISCGACTKRCPINRFMRGSDIIWTPKEYLFSHLLTPELPLEACLQCGACGQECPLEIDLPALILQAKSIKAQSSGDLRRRLLANPERLARLGSISVPLSNLMVTKPPANTVIKGLLGLDRRRRLPSFRNRTFMQWYRGRKAPSIGIKQSKTDLVYFVGCFVNYYQLEVGQALVRFCENNGIELGIPKQKCCGMPSIANGNLEGARKNAVYNINSLLRYVKEGYDVITSCPSCSLMISQEYPKFFDGEETRLIAEHTYYMESHLIELVNRGKLTVEFSPYEMPVYYHVPCHLKLQDAAQKSLELLKLIPGISIKTVNDACCGLAGYHGYKREHADICWEIGKDVFTQKTEIDEEDLVITSCAACKLQIEACTGKEVTHPICLLEKVGRF